MNNLTAILEPERHGKIKSLVESATWPDLVKQYQLNLMDPWHFRDIPVNYSDPSQPVIDHTLQNNALYLIEQGFHELTSWSHEEALNVDTQYEKSFILAYMIHVVGDVHQPLHSCALFNEKYPKGDMGGNLFLVHDNNPQIKNLHSVWDSVFSKIVDGLELPLNSTGLDILDKYTDDFMDEYSREKLAPELDDDFYFHDWLKESWQICKDFVYVAITENSKVSDDYETKGFDIAKHRMALAGYRVSDILAQAYQKYETALQPKVETLKFLQ